MYIEFDEVNLVYISSYIFTFKTELHIGVRVVKDSMDL
jgi:hypothetical protein